MTDNSTDFEITDFLPHRYPFLLVDRVLDIELGKHIRGVKNVTYNDSFFQGHFPGKPIMPGVLIVEALAQVAGVLALRTRDMVLREHGVVFYLASMDKTRFKRPVVPGDALVLEANIINERKTMMKFRCEASVDENLSCSTELMIAAGSV